MVNPKTGSCQVQKLEAWQCFACRRQLSRGISMDGKDCRDNAIRCVAMANSAKERRTQSLLVYLAGAWTKLAEELESNEAFRIAAKRVDIFKPQ